MENQWWLTAKEYAAEGALVTLFTTRGARIVL